MRRSNCQAIGPSEKTLRIAKCLSCITLIMFALVAQALSPSQVFDKVKDSVVVVKTLDASGRMIAQGSGPCVPI